MPHGKWYYSCPSYNWVGWLLIEAFVLSISQKQSSCRKSLRNNHESKLRCQCLFCCFNDNVLIILRVFTTHPIKMSGRLMNIMIFYDHFLYNPFFSHQSNAIVNRRRSTRQRTTKQTTARRTKHHPSPAISLHGLNFAIVALYKILITVRTQGLNNFLELQEVSTRMVPINSPLLIDCWIIETVALSFNFSSTLTCTRVPRTPDLKPVDLELFKIV